MGISTFSGIELGKRSLINQQLALTTAGNNISGMNKEGYTRQRVLMKSLPAIYEASLNRAIIPGQLGQGSVIASIERVKDDFLFSQISMNNSKQFYWETYSQEITQIENVYLAEEGSALKDFLDRFFESWQKLSLYPEDKGVKRYVLNNAQALSSAIQNQANSLLNLRNTVEEKIVYTVEQINQNLEEISQVNRQIAKSVAAGDNPNDLLDKRDLLSQELSQKISIKIEEGPSPDRFNIFLDGNTILQGNLYQKFSIDIDYTQDARYSIRLGKSNIDLNFQKNEGSLSSQLQIRNHILSEAMQRLDTVSVYLMDSVNEIHEKGYSVDNQGRSFFNNKISQESGFSNNAYVFRLQGSNQINANDKLAMQGELILGANKQRIPYYTNDTVKDVIKRINLSESGISAKLNSQGNLVLRAQYQSENNNFIIPYVEDNNQLLGTFSALFNPNGDSNIFSSEDTQTLNNLDLAPKLLSEGYEISLNNRPSMGIHVNPDLLADPNKVATTYQLNSRSSPIASNQAALDIAQLATDSVLLPQGESWDEYWGETLVWIGSLGQRSQRESDIFQRISLNLEEERSRLSGVNINEEIINMTKFQNAYSAMAKFMAEYNNLLDTLLNKII